MLLNVEVGVQEGFLTPDRKWVVAWVAPGPGTANIVGRRTGPDTTLVPLVANVKHDEKSPRLSPDGKWLAYMSNETGRFEVYIRPFPNTDSTKFAISTAGGGSPLWAHSGRELFYINGAREMMAVPISSGPPFRAGGPLTLFGLGEEIVHGESRSTWYDVSPDDQRFLLSRRAGAGDRGATSIVVVHNWLTEVASKLTAK